MKRLKIYTDGGVSMKNGVGGWGAIILYPNDKEVVMSGVYLACTNNQMELMSAIEGLSYVHENENMNHTSVEVITDSEYLQKGITEWVPQWIKNGWKSRTGPVKNKVLWEVLYNLTHGHKITFKWVRGHNGDVMNERVDKIAVEAYQNYLKLQSGDKPEKPNS